MAITSLTRVDLDQDEYSRYEEDRSTITAYVQASGTITDPAASDSVLVVELVKARRSRTTVVYTTTVTFTLDGGNNIRYGTITIDLTTANDPSTGAFSVRRGKYFLHIYRKDSSPSIVLNSSDFDISIVTTYKLRRGALFGLEIMGSESRNLEEQPSVITGVTFLHINKWVRAGVYGLSYIVDVNGNRKLSWGDGELITLKSTKSVYHIAPKDNTGGIAEIRVIWVLLPTVDAHETVTVVEDFIDDAYLRREINKAIAQVEGKDLDLLLEPTNVTTDQNPAEITYQSAYSSGVVVSSDWDILAPPSTFYPPRDGAWISLDFAHKPIRKIYDIYGVIAGNRILTVDPAWVEAGNRSEFAQLLPFNTMLSLEFLGLQWVGGLHGPYEMPNFWHYNGQFGYRECPFEIIELIEKRAACNILTYLSQAFQPGITSQSIARDGVSEAISFSSSSTYGVFASSIIQYQKWIDEALPRLRGKYSGLVMAVV